MSISAPSVKSTPPARNSASSCAGPTPSSLIWCWSAAGEGLLAESLFSEGGILELGGVEGSIRVRGEEELVGRGGAMTGGRVGWAGTAVCGDPGPGRGMSVCDG